MFHTKRLLLAALALAILIPLAGCHHRCCHRETSSFAPPPCCGSTTIPPGAVLPP
jgi:hypothetical protein